MCIQQGISRRGDARVQLASHAGCAALLPLSTQWQRRRARVHVVSILISRFDCPVSWSVCVKMPLAPRLLQRSK
jgi:hypothetical protein